MLAKDRSTFYREALQSPPLTPEHAPLLTFGGPPTFFLRVPPDEGALHDLVKQAHAKVAKPAASAAYEAEMRAEVARHLSSQPVYWSKVWPAGLAMSRYLLAHTSLCERKRVLELGAGLGIGAVCAAIAGASDVLCTDIEPKGLDYALASARDNNVANRLRVMAWDWNEDIPERVGGPFDVTLCGDIIYQDEHAPRLAQLLVELVKPGGAVVFSDSIERPYKDGHQSELAGRLAGNGFVQQGSHDMLIEAGARGGVAAGNKVRVLIFERRALAQRVRRGA